MFSSPPSLRHALVVLIVVLGALIIPATYTYAANECQHWTHSHYHFPYAHYDEYVYQGHRLISGNHYNDYHNTYHGDFFAKYCPGQ